MQRGLPALISLNTFMFGTVPTGNTDFCYFQYVPSSILERIHGTWIFIILIDLREPSISAIHLSIKTGLNLT
jgi:hypothetical protein